MADMDEPESRHSVDFEAVVVPDRRRRRLDPLVVGPILVVIAVLVGVAWPDSSRRDEPTPRPSPATRPTTSPPAPSDGALAIDPQGTARAESMALRLTNLGAWGIRTYALVDGAIERQWQPVDPGEGAVAPLVVVDSPSIVLIEVTSPPDLAPLDVRVWARGYVGHWDWLHTGWPAAGQPAGRVLMRPPIVDGRWLPAWPAGRYRVDLLLGERVARIDLTIDRDAPTLDAPITEWSVPPERGEPGWAVDPPAGPFAIAGDTGQPLPAAPSGALGIAEAWMAPDTAVAREWIPGATGLGVILPDAARDPHVELRRLVPEEVFAPPRPESWALDGAADAPAVAVRFDTRPRDRFDPGTYAIDATWSGPSGPDGATWTIELLPAPATSPPPLLDALRLATDLAGGDGVVRDASLVMGPAERWIEPVTAAGACDPVSASPIVALVLTGSPDDVVDAVRVTRSGSLPPGDLFFRLVRPKPGVTIVYPDRFFAFLPGDHTVSVEGSEPRTLRFCVPDFLPEPPG